MSAVRDSVMTRVEAGRKGGMTTMSRYGREYFSRIGRYGGRPPALMAEEARERLRLQAASEVAELTKGGRLPRSLCKMQRLLVLQQILQGAGNTPPAPGKEGTCSS